MYHCSSRVEENQQKRQTFIDCVTCQRLTPYKHENSLPNNLYTTNICQRRSKSTKHQHQIALDIQHGNHPSTTSPHSPHSKNSKIHELSNVNPNIRSGSANAKLVAGGAIANVLQVSFNVSNAMQCIILIQKCRIC